MIEEMIILISQIYDKLINVEDYLNVDVFHEMIDASLSCQHEDGHGKEFKKS